LRRWRGALITVNRKGLFSTKNRNSDTRNSARNMMRIAIIGTGRDGIGSMQACSRTPVWMFGPLTSGIGHIAAIKGYGPNTVRCQR